MRAAGARVAQMRAKTSGKCNSRLTWPRLTFAKKRAVAAAVLFTSRKSAKRGKSRFARHAPRQLKPPLPVAGRSSLAMRAHFQAQTAMRALDGSSSSSLMAGAHLNAALIESAPRCVSRAHLSWAISGRPAAVIDAQVSRRRPAAQQCRLSDSPLDRKRSVSAQAAKPIFARRPAAKVQLPRRQ